MNGGYGREVLWKQIVTLSAATWSRDETISTPGFQTRKHQTDKELRPSHNERNSDERIPRWHYRHHHHHHEEEEEEEGGGGGEF
jgi:hypothetical protein